MNLSLPTVAVVVVSYSCLLQSLCHQDTGIFIRYFLGPTAVAAVLSSAVRRVAFSPLLNSGASRAREQHFGHDHPGFHHDAASIRIKCGFHSAAFFELSPSKTTIIVMIQRKEPPKEGMSTVKGKFFTPADRCRMHKLWNIDYRYGWVLDEGYEAVV
jgi:hypothetical protein